MWDFQFFLKEKKSMSYYKKDNSLRPYKSFSSLYGLFSLVYILVFWNIYIKQLFN